MKDHERDPYPPVLPSWGSMMSSSPPTGYGNIRFAPDGQPSERTAAEDPVRDERALGFLARMFQRRRRQPPT